MPQPELPGAVQELQGYPDVAPGSNLAPLEPGQPWTTSTRPWRDLLEQMQDGRDAWRAGERPGPAAGLLPAERGRQGPAVEAAGGAAAKANGTAGQVRNDRAAAVPDTGGGSPGQADRSLAKPQLTAVRPASRPGSADAAARPDRAPPADHRAAGRQPCGHVRHRRLGVGARAAGTDPHGARNAACLSVVDLMRRHGGGRAGVVHWGQTAPADLALAPMPVRRGRLRRTLAIQPMLGGTNPAAALARVRELVPAASPRPDARRSPAHRRPGPRRRTGARTRAATRPQRPPAARRPVRGLLRPGEQHGGRCRGDRSPGLRTSATLSVWPGRAARSSPAASGLISLARATASLAPVRLLAIGQQAQRPYPLDRCKSPSVIYNSSTFRVRLYERGVAPCRM